MKTGVVVIARLTSSSFFGFAFRMTTNGGAVKRFHHIGLPAPDQQAPIPGEAWVASSRCWVSNPNRHPQRVEWLRYRADSPIDEAFRHAPHICYLVDDLDAAIAGKEIAVPPFEPGEPPFGRAAFTWEDAIIVEYIQLYPGRAWFDDALGRGETT